MREDGVPGRQQEILSALGLWKYEVPKAEALSGRSRTVALSKHSLTGSYPINDLARASVEMAGVNAVYNSYPSLALAVSRQRHEVLRGGYNLVHSWDGRYN
jgi:hypothetical protein